MSETCAYLAFLNQLCLLSLLSKALNSLDRNTNYICIKTPTLEHFPDAINIGYNR